MTSSSTFSGREVRSGEPTLFLGGAAIGEFAPTLGGVRRSRRGTGAVALLVEALLQASGTNRLGNGLCAAVLGPAW